MGGYHTFRNVVDIHNFISNLPEFKSIITPITSIGKTYWNKDIPYFTIGNDINNPKRPKKSAVLLTALHHAREPTSLTVLLAAWFDGMNKLLKNNEIFNDIDIIFIPVVNRDSYEYMNEHYLGKNWNQTRFIRKNRNITNKCYTRSNFYKGGVDLNRNYGYKWKFSKNHGGHDDPCQSDYRGTGPFSEKETQAMKSFIEKNPQIVSAMNFHGYGDLWISPFSYERDGANHALEA